MTKVIYERTRFNKHYLKDLFTNELMECTEEDFNEIVIAFRGMYEMRYDGPNRQIFLMDGVIEAAREISVSCGGVRQ